ncbi:MAG: hypothetical protein DDT36_00199 [Firmicutes bacterium]|nr:hypothetical protein [Bacillota bacterium]
MQQPFAGSHILSGNPSVQNNHALVAVGALNIDGQFFLPMQTMERMLGVSYQHRDGEHFLGERRLIAAELQQVGAGVFLAARLIEEVAGRGYFFDALRNTLDFSVSRLVVDGTFVGYNNIFWHSEHGPMVEMAALGSSLGLVFTLGANGRIHVGGVALVGMTIGSQTFICLREIRRLPLTVSWEAASGLIAISQRH